MEKKKDIKIMDISGKDSLECPNCGLVLKIPPRTISMEGLKHMQDNQRFMDWLQKNTRQSQDVKRFGNVRMMICSRCEQMIICKDEFTIEKKED